jgi:IgGFc binding protein
VKAIHVLLAIAACGPPPRGVDTGGTADAGDDPNATTCGIGREHSYIGCDYWPVDLPNAIDIWGDATFGCTAPSSPRTMAVCTAEPFATIVGPCDYAGGCSQYPLGTCETKSVCALDAQHAPFAIVVANPDDVETATITLRDAAGVAYTTDVAPNAVVPLYPQEVGFPDHSIEVNGITDAAYHLHASRPIVAYQFNPLNDVGVFSNDASLLIPSDTFDRRYFNVSYWSNQMAGYATVVASEPGVTTVTVHATAAIRAGRNQTAIPAGGTASFALQRYDTLTLMAATGGDPTGMELVGDQPFGAFGGHEATPVSKTDPGCFADHLEEQLFPASTWGTHFALARSVPRRDAPDMLRIVAQSPNTHVQITPAAASGSCGTLGPGQSCDLYVDRDVEVTSTEPIMIARFLLSVGAVYDGACDANDPRPPGDPSLAIVTPVEQFRSDYQFLAPMYYTAHHALIVVPDGGTAILDGTDVTSSLAPFGSGAYRGGRIPIQAGPHRLACAATCGIEVQRLERHGVVHVRRWSGSRADRVAVARARFPLGGRARPVLGCPRTARVHPVRGQGCAHLVHVVRRSHRPLPAGSADTGAHGRRSCAQTRSRSTTETCQGAAPRSSRG